MAKGRDFIKDEDEVPGEPRKETPLGVWSKQKYLNGCENMKVATGISMSVIPQGGNNYEVNIVGEKSYIIAGTMDEAKNQARNMLRDKLAGALEIF